MKMSDKRSGWILIISGWKISDAYYCLTVIFSQDLSDYSDDLVSPHSLSIAGTPHQKLETLKAILSLTPLAFMSQIHQFNYLT